jgi:hypothetical protein
MQPTALPGGPAIACKLMRDIIAAEGERDPHSRGAPAIVLLETAQAWSRPQILGYIRSGADISHLAAERY